LEIRLAIASMNGGNAYEIPDTTYPDLKLPAADSISAIAFRVDPEIKVLEAEKKLAAETVRLQRSLWLPQFKVGYGEETVLSDTYRGVQAGITVPLWQNLNTVRQAVLRKQAIEMEYDACRNRIKAALESKTITITALKTNIDRYSNTLEPARNDVLLRTSLETGNISIIDYFQERRFRYEVFNRYLSEECEYYKGLVDFIKYQW
jgi:outer membrane protein TolC